MGIFSDYVAYYTCKLFKHFVFLCFTRVLCIYVPLNLSSMNKHPSSRYWILTFYYAVRYYWIWKSKSDNNMNEKIRCEVNTVTIHRCIRNTSYSCTKFGNGNKYFEFDFVENREQHVIRKILRYCSTFWLVYQHFASNYTLVSLTSQNRNLVQTILQFDVE